MSLGLLFNRIRKCRKITENLRINLRRHLSEAAEQVAARRPTHRGLSQKSSAAGEACAEDEAEAYQPFSDLIEFRRTQARRSVVVQVQSAHSCQELLTYCSQYGDVAHMFHYSTGVEPLHFILVEFGSERDVQDVLVDSSFVEDAQIVPVQSPFLWFKVSGGGKSPLRRAARPNVLKLENGTRVLRDEVLREQLQRAADVSEQVRLLHAGTRLTDLGARLRFVTARQVEAALAGMFPAAAAYPFGSTTNGYGAAGCDLDLALRLDARGGGAAARLVHHSKAGAGGERAQAQRHMEALGDLLHLFLPGCADVRRILQARVPILKYRQQLTAVDCDLSMTNADALHMSELLYLLGAADSRVRPLVCAVRRWAARAGLTSPAPGRWITNFSLTLLVLAYLQRPGGGAPVLPPVDALRRDTSAGAAGPLRCAFPRDLAALPASRNTDTLEALLLGFFQHYAAFDFSRAVSLNEAAAVPKPEHSPLHIVNPLERALNVSKNVSSEELQRLRTEMRSAAWLLEARPPGPWGLAALLEGPRATPRRHHARLMEVHQLFDEQRAQDGTDGADGSRAHNDGR